MVHSITLRPVVGNATICHLTYRLETDLELMVHEVLHAMGLVRMHLCGSMLAFPCILFSVLFACTMH
jgi:hypothetical protein